MLDRFNLALKWSCIALVILAAGQFARLLSPSSPARRFSIPPALKAYAAKPAPPAPSSTNLIGNAPVLASLTNLAPALQRQFELIKESEIFGPVPRPMSMPAALLGIAGPYAFLRASSGQTGLLQEGEQLAELKLLRIGTNRVLVEEHGQKKELTIFSGFGGESLAPQGKETQ